MFKYLLPVLFPSWRFFSSIGPSPRIEWSCVDTLDAAPDSWFAFRPLPQKVGFIASVWRLLHNPEWNERLYINSCAEHVFNGDVAFYAQEIGERLAAAVAAGELITPQNSRYLVFRIRTLEQVREVLEDEVVFVSTFFSLKLVGEQE